MLIDSIPIYIDLNFHVHDMVTLYMDLGVKNHFCLSSLLSNISGTYSTWGVYPQYGDLVLDYKTGLNQFSNESQFSLNPSTMTMRINDSMDFLSAIGVRVKLKNKQFFPLYADFSLGYQHSIIVPYRNKFASKIEDTNELILPEDALMTYTVQNGEAIESLTKFVSEIKRKIFTVNFSLIYKF